MRRAGATADERAAEAIELVESKRDSDVRWLLENQRPGRMAVELDEGEGGPSRWNTLRASRVPGQRSWVAHGEVDLDPDAGIDAYPPRGDFDPEVTNVVVPWTRYSPGCPCSTR